MKETTACVQGIQIFEVNKQNKSIKTIRPDNQSKVKVDRKYLSCKKKVRA